MYILEKNFVDAILLDIKLQKIIHFLYELFLVFRKYNVRFPFGFSFILIFAKNIYVL